MLARARATVAAGGAIPRFPARDLPPAPRVRGTARSPSGLDRVRGVGRGGRRRGRRGGGAPRPRRARAAARRAGACGPGAERSADERRHARRANRSPPTPSVAAARPPRPARPGAKADPFTRRARSASARSCRVHAARLLGRADADRGARAPVPEGAPRRAARGVARAVAGGLWPCGRSASCRGCVRDPISTQRSAAAGRGRLGIREAVIVRRAGPAGLRRRGPSIVAGAVWTRSPRSAFDRAARIRGGPRLSRRRGLQGRRHRPAGLRPLRRKRARARAGPHRAAHGGHRRTHRVARCERQVGRRADVPVGEHRLSPPRARDGLCARRPDSAPGKGGRSSRRERRGAGRDRIPARGPATAEPPIATIPSPEAPTVPRAADAAPAPTGGPRPVFAVGAGPSVGVGMSSAPVMLGASVRRARVAAPLGRARRRREPARDDPTRGRRRLLAAAPARAAPPRARLSRDGTDAWWRTRGRSGWPGRSTDPLRRPCSLVQVGVRAGITQRLGRRAFLERTRGRPRQSDPLDGQPRPGPGLDRAAIRRGARRRRRRAVSVALLLGLFSRLRRGHDRLRAVVTDHLVGRRR